LIVLEYPFLSLWFWQRDWYTCGWQLLWFTMSCK